MKYRISKELAASIALNKDFLSACEIIAANREQIDFTSGRVSTSKDTYSVVWEIFGENANPNVEFSKLRFEFDGKESFVFFEALNREFQEIKQELPTKTNAKFKWPPSWWPGGGGGGGGSGFCWSWTPWVANGTTCKYSFWCFFKNQRATFIEQKRQCLTNPNHVQTRSCKDHCGC